MKKKKKIEKGQNERATRSFNGNVFETLLVEGKNHFLLHGISGLSVRRIAEQTGINLGSFVYHFKTKEEFVQLIFQEIYADFLKDFDGEFEKIESSATSPVQKLERLLLALSRFSDENYQLLFRILLEISAGEPGIFHVFAKNPPRHVIVMNEIICECQKQKLIRSDLTPLQIYFLCMSTVGASTVIARQIGHASPNPKVKKKIHSLLAKKFAKTRMDFVMSGLKSVG
ncbi:MAG: TetR/AcrR family transcriptional regulator [Bdellovibrionota bacterium]